MEMWQPKQENWHSWINSKNISRKVQKVHTYLLLLLAPMINFWNRIPTPTNDKFLLVEVITSTLRSEGLYNQDSCSSWWIVWGNVSKCPALQQHPTQLLHRVCYTFGHCKWAWKLPNYQYIHMLLEIDQLQHPYWRLISVAVRRGGRYCWNRPWWHQIERCLRIVCYISLRDSAANQTVKPHQNIRGVRCHTKNSVSVPHIRRRKVTYAIAPHDWIVTLLLSVRSGMCLACLLVQQEIAWRQTKFSSISQFKRSGHSLRWTLFFVHSPGVHHRLAVVHLLRYGPV